MLHLAKLFTHQVRVLLTQQLLAKNPFNDFLLDSSDEQDVRNVEQSNSTSYETG